MMIRLFLAGILSFLVVPECIGQTVTITVSPGQLLGPLNANYTPGTFFVPKTSDGYNDFMTNGIHQEAIRTNVIESALNNSSNLAQCLSLLQTTQGDLVSLSQRCDRLIFIFEKMPAWLSSSSDGSPAQTPSWYVLNTKAPANWTTWQTVVDSIASQIINQMGITNAWFEIWNEPDIGSWTGTMNEYWMLYRTTYDGIKSASVSAMVGGPAVNGWANNIGWQPAYGFADNLTADSSLIGQLLDSSVVWNRIPDFISWHNFDMNQYEFENATSYISWKVNSLSISQMPLVISEWNAPSAVRETALAISYVAKFPFGIEHLTAIHCNVVAAWQDFSQSTNEFHQDYGLLSYGAIHKPAYYASLLNEKMNGSACVLTASNSLSLSDARACVTNDTVFVVIANYSPPPIFEALNFSMHNGQSNVYDLDTAGYINIASADLTHIDSIYRGLIPIVPMNTMEQGIADGIPIYQHYDSVAQGPQTFNLTLSGYSSNYYADVFIIDSTSNNMQFRYDSLRNAGYTQNNAIAYVTATQSLQSYQDTLVNGTGSVTLEPNAVCLWRIVVPGVSGIHSYSSEHGFTLFPNPTSSAITLHWEDNQLVKRMVITDMKGRAIVTVLARNDQPIELDHLDAGMYFITEEASGRPSAKFIVE